jgi:hypothetical protein
MFYTLQITRAIPGGSMVRFVCACLGLLLLRPAVGAAADAYAPDVAEPGSVEAIAKFTTEPRFSNPWVAYVPDSSTVPSPTEYLGHVAGAAGELSRTGQIYGYFRELAKASPRVKVEVIGEYEEGREILLVAVADEEGIRDLARRSRRPRRPSPTRGRRHPRPRKRSSRRPARSTTSMPACTRRRRAAPKW